MDVLSDILHTIRLSGSLWCRTEAAAPWSMAINKPDAAHFHLIWRGSCWFQMPGIKAPLQLTGGDLVLLPHGDYHFLSDNPATEPVSLEALIERHPSKAEGVWQIGARGQKTTLVCGYLNFDRSQVHPLFSVLPPLIHIKAEEHVTLPLFENTLSFIFSESNLQQPGSEVLTNLLVEALFIQIIRLYVDRMPAETKGWLRGLKDPQISRSLALMHDQTEHSWTLASLSAATGMSRAAFAAKFKQIVGEPPLQYLTRWRMHKAAILLKLSEMVLAEIAEKVGYRTEAGFSKVFKRYLSLSPGAYRREYT